MSSQINKFSRKKVSTVLSVPYTIEVNCSIYFQCFAEKIWFEKQLNCTLGLTISDVEFPAVVICSEGFDIDAIAAIIYSNIFHYMNTSIEEQVGISPIQCAKMDRRLALSVTVRLSRYSRESIF